MTRGPLLRGTLCAAALGLALLHASNATAEPNASQEASQAVAEKQAKVALFKVYKVQDTGEVPSDPCTADAAESVAARRSSSFKAFQKKRTRFQELMAREPASEDTGSEKDNPMPRVIGVAGPWKSVPPLALEARPLEGNPAAIARVGQVLEKAIRGEPVRISIFGDSHTSGASFSGQIRRVLQGRYGDQGHGFIMPAALYKWYRGTDINLCRSKGWRADYVGKRGSRRDGLLGFGGMSVSSNNPADFGWLQTTTSGPLGSAVSFYDIYTLRRPGGGTLLAQVDSATPVKISTSGKTGLMLSRIEVADGPHRLTLSPAGDGEVRILGVSAERDQDKGVIVDTIGIRGQQAHHGLKWTDEMMKQGIAQLSPDLLVLQYGTNEAADTNLDFEKYRTNLRAVISRFQQAVPDAACLLVGPTDRAEKQVNGDYKVWALTEPVAAVQRELSTEMGCAFWDWQQAKGGPGSIVAWRFNSPRLAGKDTIHLKTKGYVLSANLLVEALYLARPTNQSE